MPFVYNACPREKSVCAQGNWFTFKPKQVKFIGSDTLAVFLTSNCGYEGLVRVGEGFEDPEYRKSEAGKKEITDADAGGLKARAAYLQSIINNTLNGLRRDLERHNDKSDPRSHMSDGMIANMEELAEIKQHLSKAKLEQLAKIAELEAAISE